MKIELNLEEMLLIDKMIIRQIEIYNDILKYDEKNICQTIREDKETLKNIKEKLWGKEVKT